MEPLKGKVLEIENYFVKGEIGAQVVKLNVENRFDFKPGQYAMLSEEGFRLRSDSSQVKWTSYSIASSPNESGVFEFVYTVRKTGGFTQYLSENLKVGSVLGIRGPYGTFALDNNEKGKVFVATGAGIAPMISMIRTLGEGTLFYGFRTGEHFLYRKELESLEKEGKIKLMPTISREDPSWKGERGYVTRLVEKSELDPKKQEVYVCGSPAMVNDVKQILLEKNFSHDSVKIEQW